MQIHLQLSVKKDENCVLYYRTWEYFGEIKHLVSRLLGQN